MTNTPILGLPVVSASQGQMYLPHNAALDQIDALCQLSVKSINQTAPPVSPSPGDRYIVATGATGAWAGWDDSVAVFLLTGAWQRLIPATGWQTWVESLARQYIYVAGWKIVIAVAAYDIGASFAGTPTDSEVLGRISVPRKITLLADFLGSAGHVVVNPTDAFAVDVLDDGSSIGTISITTGGVVSFASAGGTAKVIAAGSLVSFVGQATADATIAGISFTLAGTV